MTVESVPLTAKRTDRIALSRRERYASVHALLDDGPEIRTIARDLRPFYTAPTEHAAATRS